MLTQEFLQAQLKKLPPSFGLELKGKYAWVRCPAHGNGQERTPSLMINLLDKGRFKAGSARCHGCGKFYGNWDRTAQALGLAFNAEALEERAYNPFSPEQDKHLYGDDGVQLPDPRDMLPWEAQQDWRTISGKLVAQVGGQLMLNPQTQRLELYLPCYVNGEHVGGVRANLRKRGKRNYFNLDGEWSRTTGLFPYDYVKRMLRRRKLKRVVLVEGCRDALRCIQYGIPALAILGTGSWSETKADLVLALDIEEVITAMDGDAAGKAATKLVFVSLREQIPVRRFKFPDDVDPGNAPAKLVRKLRDAIYA